MNDMIRKLELDLQCVARFRVNALPKGQPRARACVRGRHAAMYDPGTAKPWKQALAYAAAPHKPAQPITCSVVLNMVVYLPRPKRLMRKRDAPGAIPAPVKPDKDNLEKGVFDALTMAGWWTDDQLIIGGQTWKFYHAKDGHPGADIEIYTLTHA